MDLVIFCDNYPPEKKFWASPDIAERLEWSWVSELIATWFCYSNGIRKENNVVLVVNDLEIRLKGEEIRYLAPSQRSILSIVYNAYKLYQTQSKKKEHQPGVYVDKFSGFDQFVKPWANIVLSEERPLHTKSGDPELQTIMVNATERDVPILQIAANNYNQALIWIIYQ